MGSLFSSSTSSESSGDPIKQQAFNTALPYWTKALGGASSLYDQVNANPAYTGQRVADLNPYQISSATNLGNYSNATSGIPTAFNATGFNNLAAGDAYGNNANSIYNLSSVDPTGMIMRNAMSYANNPYTDQMITAANRDVVRDLGENQLAGINRAAAGTGNLNSSRAGVQDAIAQRGAMDRMADVAANIRSQFFGKGLDMAQNQWNQNLTNQLNANNQLLNASNLGQALINAGQGYATNNFTQGQQAGNMFQQQNQNQLNANKSVFDESLQNRLAVLQALTGTAGAGQGWSGGPTSTTETKSPSKAAIAGSILSAFF